MIQKSRTVGPEYEMPSQPCLNCDAQLDAASSIDHSNKPKPGNVTICIRCGHLMAFDKKLRFRALTDEEMIKVAGDQTILDVQRARGHVLLYDQKKSGVKP